MQVAKYAPEITNVINNYSMGVTRNLLLGAGLGFAIQTEKYWHLPVVFIFPLPYVGYQGYKHKNEIVNWVRSCKLV